MSYNLLYSNECKFAGCNLNFSTMYDLIAHIEIEHIPVQEADELRRKEEDGSGRATATSNLPLSYYYRLFPQPYRPVPCPVEVVKVSFSHYRKRPAPGATTMNVDPTSSYPQNTSSQLPFSNKKKDSGETHSTRNDLVEDEHTVPPEDLEEADPGDPEASERFRCQIKSCAKLYKNVHGVRNHMAVAHSAPPAQPASADDLQGVIVTGEGVVGHQSPSKSRPFKCNHCAKRYKSQNGLHTHMNKEHPGIPSVDSPANAAMPPGVQINEQKSQTTSAGNIRTVASQPQLSNIQPQSHYQQSPLAAQALISPHGQHGITTHPAPNIQVRQLLPPSHQQPSRSPVFQHQQQNGYFQMSDAFQPSTGSVLQAQFNQQSRVTQMNVHVTHSGNARSPAYVGSAGEYARTNASSPQYNLDFAPRPMVPANASNN